MGDTNKMIRMMLGFRGDRRRHNCFYI
jgi:hypothetical protein